MVGHVTTTSKQFRGHTPPAMTLVIYKIKLSVIVGIVNYLMLLLANSYQLNFFFFHYNMELG